MSENGAMRLRLHDRPHCPLCESSTARVHVAFPDIPVHRCDDCGFIYSGRTLGPDSLDAYYRSGFGSDRQLQGQKVNAGVNLAVLSRLVDLAGVRRFLDVGTGYGFLLQALEDSYGIRGKGVELSDQEATYARETLGVDVEPCLLSEADLPHESFDLVASFEVIEHVPDPKSFLAELAAYVRPGGSLLVMTDNFESWACESLGPAFPKWIPHAHVSHFAPATLERCIEITQGLRVASVISYTPWELVARVIASTGRRAPTPENSFDLEATLRTEMGGTYRFYALRRAINRLWVRATHRRDARGALMYFLARKAGPDS